MLHVMAAGQEPRPHEPLRGWGCFTRYLEIGDDLYAVRCIDVYENGYALLYDRVHWIDDYGMLADVRYSKKWDKWWGPVATIDPVEFDRVWREAELSPTRQLQLDSAQMARRGAVPIWLARRDKS